MRRCFACVLMGCAVGCSAAAKDELVPLESVPANVMDIAKEKLPEVNFDQALKRADGSYEIRGKDKKGKVRDIEMKADGEILEIE